MFIVVNSKYIYFIGEIFLLKVTKTCHFNKNMS